jgi:hypothetical protein
MRWLDARLVFIVLVLVPGLVLLILIFLFEEHASLTEIDIGAVITVLVTSADVFLRGQLIAIGGMVETLDEFVPENHRVPLDVLRSDLEGVETEASAAWVEVLGTDSLENLGEGELNGG